MRENAVFTQRWNRIKDPRLSPVPAINMYLCNPLTKQASHPLLSLVYTGHCVTSTAVSPSAWSDGLPAMKSPSWGASACLTAISEERKSVPSTDLTHQCQGLLPISGRTAACKQRDRPSGDTLVGWERDRETA